MEKGLEGYRQRIEEGLKGILNEREKQDRLYEPIQHMLSIGGKRFRPSALLMACEMFGGEIEDGFHAALGIELFHNFTLMHDDLMDEAPLRRGKPTVHRSYGRDMAVLSGDAMFVKAYQEIGKVEERVLPTVMDDFNRVSLEVCEGQRMDMDFEEREDVGVDEYLRMIASKTGALLGGALAIGARLGGGNEEEVERMEKLGRNAGIAFQLQDDLLDVFGDEGKFGKQKGGDIIARKKTYLSIRASEKADPSQKERFQEAWGGSDEGSRVERISELYRELAIEEETRERSDAYFEEALKELDRIELKEERKAPLRLLIASLQVREA